MTSTAAVILDEDLYIPAGISSLDRFREWSQSDQFPKRGRIDYLEGTLEIDLSPEDLYTHGVVKTAITSQLYLRIVETDRGNVFVDRTRIVSTTAELSVEPDVLVVLWSSLKEGRVREIPVARAAEDRFIEFEGAPDLVVEIVSDRSVRKDLEHLPRLYAAAGIPEMWTVDARGDHLLFQILVLGASGYARQPADPGGWIPSPLLGVSCRLLRRRAELSRWSYRLQFAG
jgi:Uma2 family endonuclease